MPDFFVTGTEPCPCMRGFARNSVQLDLAQGLLCGQPSSSGLMSHQKHVFMVICKHYREQIRPGQRVLRYSGLEKEPYRAGPSLCFFWNSPCILCVRVADTCDRASDWEEPEACASPAPPHPSLVLTPVPLNSFLLLLLPWSTCVQIHI